MWKGETEAVKDDYKRRSEDAKRQHSIANPGYQYQPRKSSEKKKRMTKNKLAKMQAQASAAAASDPMKDLDEMLNETANDEQVTIDTFQAPYRQDFPNLQPSQEVNNHLTFDTTGEYQDLLLDQLVAWNASNPGVPGGLFSRPSVVMGQPLADGQVRTDVSQTGEAARFTHVGGNFATPVPEPTTTDPALCLHDPTAEVERQERIANAAIGELFNFDAYANPLVEGEDADNILQNFHNNFAFDFDQSGNYPV